MTYVNDVISSITSVKHRYGAGKLEKSLFFFPHQIFHFMSYRVLISCLKRCIFILVRNEPETGERTTG